MSIEKTAEQPGVGSEKGTAKGEVQSVAQTSACCPAPDQATCCAPSEKSSCCGTPGASTWGCK
jgi:hypothetical protein